MTLPTLHGFTVTNEKKLPELDAVLYRMTHDKTGLELVWIKRDEENKTFGIAFETLPEDNTGVFHILEHSVLCGSEKYPVKEPFVELMKSSMNTFLNALTFPDKTFYPISSRSDKDFINLMQVYLDAVFFPSIYTKPEIFRQEGWHYELDDSGKACYKGVVFNEMKGSFASADTLLDNELNRLLFPDSPYRFVSGGDPASIPDLSYEKFLENHRRFYSPSNAYIFLDGDLNIDETLRIINDEYLSRFDKGERMAPPAVQQPVSGSSEIFYELAPGEDPDGKNRLSYGMVISEFDEREKLISAQILSELLCGSNHSPLTQAVLSAGLAEEVTMGVSDGIMQPWLYIDIKNIRDDNISAVEALVNGTLSELSENGLDHSQLEAIMANYEFRLRERDYGYYPQGLILGFIALESWLYGGDPSSNLEVGDLFVNLKNKMNEGYFERLLKDLVLKNAHSAKVILHPSVSLGDERRAAEQARLDRETSSWDDDERRAVSEQQAKLLEWQNSEDTPEALETIPKLVKEDIPTEPERLPTTEAIYSGITVLEHELSTAGVVYVNIYFDADGCDEEELSYLSFASDLLGQTATSKHTAEEILNRVRLLCGNIGSGVSIFTDANNADKTSVKFIVRFSTLKSNLKEALDLVIEILTDGVLTDDAAHDILRQSKMQLFQQIIMAGTAAAARRVEAQFLPSGAAGERIDGITYYEWLKSLDDNWNFEHLSAKVSTALGSVVNRSNMVLGVTGTSTDEVKELARVLSEIIPEKLARPKVGILPWGIRKEGIVIPADISFAVMGGNIADTGYSFTGHAMLASRIITLSYLWNVIRVQGGAYGTSMAIRGSGLTTCHSYRDPDCAASVKSFGGCAEFLRGFASHESDFTGFMIGAVSNDSPLMTPRVRAQSGESCYFSGTTWESRCQRRKELLATTAADLIAVADALDEMAKNSGICIVGSQNQLDSCDYLDNIIIL